MSMDVFVWTPASSAFRGAVTAVYGSAGLDAKFKPLIETFCQKLVAEGYLVFLPDYLQCTGTPHDVSRVLQDVSSGKWTSWTTALATTIKHSRTRAGNGKCAVAGFSLGGNLALHAAVAEPVNCAVDYFAPINSFTLGSMPTAMQISSAMAKKLPPTLIHHGTMDFVVRNQQSQILKTMLDAANIRGCVLHTDYQCGHPGQPELAWTDAADTSATKRTIKFLQSSMQG